MKKQSTTDLNELESLPVWRSPIKVGPFLLRNRICIPAHSYSFENSSKGVEAFDAYISKRLASDVALIVIGESEISWDSSLNLIRSRVAGEPSARLYEKLTKTMNQFGGVILEQVFLPGGQVWHEENRVSFAPSIVPQPNCYSIPLELSKANLRSILKALRQSAFEIAKYGLNGVELKADQGKMHHQFLSRKYNERNDCYGGCLTGRIRFIIESLEHLREGLGKNRILGLRIPCGVTPPTNCPGGASWHNDLTLDECKKIVEIVSATNLVDYFSISGETNSTAWGYVQNHGDGIVKSLTFEDDASQIRRLTSLPIMLSGKIGDLLQAEKVLQNGSCDLIGMARAFIADPEIIPKTKSGNLKSIRKCTGCNISCVGRTWYGKSVRCVYNPTAGRESVTSYSGKKAFRIGVLGAGPAGLEFSRVSAMFGSEVVLYEKTGSIGGLIKPWHLLPSCAAMKDAISYWEECTTHSKITLNLNTEQEPYELVNKGFDHIVIATGSTFPSKYEDTRRSGILQWSPENALLKRNWQNRKVAVFDGSPFRDGMGIAEMVVRKCGVAWLISPLDLLGLGLNPVTHARRISTLELLNIPTYCYTDIEVCNGHLLLLNHATNIVKTIEGVTDVIWCINGTPSIFLNQTRQDNIHVVGEASGNFGLYGTVINAHDLAVSIHC